MSDVPISWTKRKAVLHSLLKKHWGTDRAGELIKTACAMRRVVQEAKSDRQLWDAFFKANDGQPRTVRMLNLFEKSAGRDGDFKHNSYAEINLAHWRSVWRAMAKNPRDYKID